MRAGEITEVSANKLSGNVTAAVSLSFAVLILYLTVLFLTDFISVFIKPSLNIFGGSNQIGVSVQTVFGMIFTVILMFPFEIGIKGWYLSLRGEYCSPISAFFYFKGMRYFHTVLYCIVKKFAVFAVFFVPLLPSIVIASALKVLFKVSKGHVGILFGILFVLFIILTLIAVVFGVYCFLSMFFADYLYIRGIIKTPFQAIRLSFQIARGDRGRLLVFMVCLLPYYLLCFLGATIPFIIPKIQSALAAYADDRIDSYTGGTTCQF